MASEGLNGHEQQRVLFWVSLEELRGGRDLPMGSKSRYNLCWFRWTFALEPCQQGSLSVLPKSAHKLGTLALREDCEHCQPHHK